jgi:5-formyltetrahydrofolate cyclo-ligase
MARIMTKANLRATLKQRLQALPKKTEKSQAICLALNTWLSKHQPTILGAFSPTSTEPNIWPLVEQHRKKHPIVLPRFNSHTQQYEWAHYTGALEKGPFGILEPPPTADAALPPNWCWVPAVGVDNNGVRLGWGHGYYDRLLNPQAMHRVGVVFHCQRVPHIPSDPWDVTLTDIICETTPS